MHPGPGESQRARERERENKNLAHSLPQLPQVWQL